MVKGGGGITVVKRADEVLGLTVPPAPFSAEVGKGVQLGPPSVRLLDPLPYHCRQLHVHTRHAQLFFRCPSKHSTFG